MSHDNRYYFHPSYIVMILVLSGISALFLGFSAALIYSRVQNGQEPQALPSLFIYNTLILILSSITLRKALEYYKNDKSSLYQLSLVVTCLLSLGFLISQLIAWKQLYEIEIFIDHSNGASYLYIISIIHFLHLVAGLPFLFYFTFRAISSLKEPVSSLIYFSDPQKMRRLKLISIYWHFLDILWIYLIVFFSINQSFKFI